MEKCLYCKKKLDDNYYENKIGFFCSEEHFEKYLKSLSPEEYVELQTSMCVCSDDQNKKCCIKKDINPSDTALSAIGLYYVANCYRRR